jgi:periplasmic protein TonB
MTRRKAITVSIALHVALLGTLAILFLHSAVKEPSPPPVIPQEPDVVVEKFEEEKPEKKPDEIEIREPKKVENHAEVDPIDLPPSPKPVEFEGAVSDDVVATPQPPEPKAIAKPAPDFPDKARRDGVSGQVRAIITIGPDGHVIQVEIVSATPEGYFEKATIKALSKWRYEEQLVTPVSSNATRQVTVTIDFDLEDR